MAVFTQSAIGLAAALMLGVAALPLAAHAERDLLIEGARQCTQYFPVEEKKNAIPTHLLAAIATTESGRWHDGLGMSVPWPWTINVEGKGYYFNSKAEAVAQVQNLLAKGVQSIDVGCMQVNLKHHPRAFTDLSQAFEPKANVAYAAKFLHDNYATLGDWIKATAAYHSRTPVYGQRYLVDIERSWNRIVGKVAQARAGKAGATSTTANTVTTTTTNTAVTGMQAGVRVASAAPVKPVAVTTMHPVAEARRARVISVSDAPRRSTGEVMVIKAAAPVESPTKPVTVADADPLVTTATGSSLRQASGDTVRRVSLDNAASSAVAKPAGPNYVFAN